MPRDPSLPGTQLLETPAARADERPPVSADDLEFGDTTSPGGELVTLDESTPAALLEGLAATASEWDEDVETLVDDAPGAPS